MILDRADRYRAWIEDLRRRRSGDLVGCCESATAEMVASFPELLRVRGHVRMWASPDGDERAWTHWWCLTPDGAIMDPTASQFPSPLDYMPFDEARPYAGRCRTCGEPAYAWHGGEPFCDDRCARAFTFDVLGGEA